MFKLKFVKIYLASVISLWCLLVVLPPILAFFGWFEYSKVGYRFFSLFCHQRPERSLFLLGYPLAVCSRCAAMYFGLLAGTIIQFLTDNPMPKRRWMLLAFPPIILDILTQTIGLRESTNAIRAITGGLAGFTAPFYIYPYYFRKLESYLDRILKIK